MAWNSWVQLVTHNLGLSNNKFHFINVEYSVQKSYSRRKTERKSPAISFRSFQVQRIGKCLPPFTLGGADNHVILPRLRPIISFILGYLFRISGLTPTENTQHIFWDDWYHLLIYTFDKDEEFRIETDNCNFIWDDSLIKYRLFPSRLLWLSAGKKNMENLKYLIRRQLRKLDTYGKWETKKHISNIWRSSRIFSTRDIFQ